VISGFLASGFAQGFGSGLLVGVAVTVLGHILRERSQDKREKTHEVRELRALATKVRAEVARNRNERAVNTERISAGGVIPRDADASLRADAWNEEYARLHQLMPREGFERLQDYYRELEAFAAALRGYHAPALTKNDRPILLQKLGQLAEQLATAERAALDATSEYLDE
jgi:hypothetical protein